MPKDKHGISYADLTGMQLDALREVGNIGAGHAAVALTQFLNRSTYMSIPKVGLEKIDNLDKIVKMPRDKRLAIVSVETVKDLYYDLIVFFDDESVQRIVDLMTTADDKDKAEIVELSPLFLSLIKEVGSILLLKYVEALNDFLEAEAFPSPPKLRIGTVDSITKHEIKDIKGAADVLYIECDVYTNERNIQVDMAIIPHEKTFDRFMSSLFAEDT